MSAGKISDAKSHIQRTAGGKMWFFSRRSREEISEKTAGVEPSAVRAAVLNSSVPTHFTERIHCDQPLTWLLKPRLNGS